MFNIIMRLFTLNYNNVLLNTIYYVLSEDVISKQNK